MELEERQMLSDSLGKTLARSTAATARHALEEFGWFDLLEEDAETAVDVLARLQGAQLTPVTFLDDAVLAAAGLPGSYRVVYPTLPSSEPTSHLIGDVLVVDGLVTAGEAPMIVAAKDGDATVFAVLASKQLPTGEPAAIDVDGPWREIRGEIPAGALELVEPAGPNEAWSRMRGTGQRMLAAELQSIGVRMLELAVAHVSEREQFGHKIGSFQAVKHALADVRVWQECAELASAAAWEDLRPVSAQLAKIIAGRFVRLAAANCQQVLGGMGFTWEHDFHRYLRRSLLLEPLLGSAAALRVVLGSQVQSEGLPRLAPL